MAVKALRRRNTAKEVTAKNVKGVLKPGSDFKAVRGVPSDLESNINSKTLNAYESIQTQVNLKVQPNYQVKL